MELNFVTIFHNILRKKINFRLLSGRSFPFFIVFLCFSLFLFHFLCFSPYFCFWSFGGSKGSSTPLLLSPDWSPGRLTGCAQTAWAIALTCVSGRRSTATIRWAPRPASKPKWFEPKWLLLLAVVGCCWLLLAVVGCCCC